MKAIPANGILEDQSNFQEWLNTPEGTWDLNGWDLASPPSGSVSNVENEISGKGSRVTGRISPPRAQGAQGYSGSPGPTNLGFAVHVLHSLRDMKQFSGNVVPTQGRDGRGDPTWVLRLKPRVGQFVFSVHLNPKYNFMISAWKMTGGSEIDWQVEEFQEPAPGVFIAKSTLRTIMQADAKRPLLVKDAIEVSDVNRPIPESDLGLEYPAGALIGDDRDQTFNIWGDGKPALTFSSPAEFDKWRMDRVAQAMTAKRRWWTQPVALAVMIGSALVLLTLLGYRRRLLRSMHGE